MLPLVVIHGNNKNTAQHQCRTTTTNDLLSLMATKQQDWKLKLTKQDERALEIKIRMFYEALKWDMPVDKANTLERFF